MTDTELNDLRGGSSCPFDTVDILENELLCSYPSKGTVLYLALPGIGHAR